jgi:predicted ABC-type ATPase
MVFVGVDDVALVQARIASRVRAGGHNVPIDDVRRRFHRSMENLQRASIVFGSWTIPANVDT